MDKNAVIGFVLIGIVLMVWLFMNAPPPPESNQAVTDSLKTAMVRDSLKRSVPAAPAEPEAQSDRDTLGKYFSHLITGETKSIFVSTPNYKAEISTKGGTVRSWQLSRYKTWNQYPIDLINYEKSGDFHLLFYSSDGKLIQTKNLIFKTAETRQNIVIEGKDSVKIEFILPVGEKNRIIKTYVFSGDLYSFDVLYRFEGMNDIIANFSYQVTWESGLRFVERNSVDESNHAKAMAFTGGEVSSIDASRLGETVKDSSISGRVSWIGTRNKYFAVVMIPRNKESKRATMEGIRTPLPDEGARETYSIALEMPYLGNPDETDRFTIFLGPLDFDVIKKYDIGLENMMSLGAAWIIRPISEYVIIPIFKFLRMFIPNYGIVLIIFSILIKIVLHPLTRSSMRSMQKMQALQPMMTEIREKYKEDPQKMNQQVMRLYKEYGVNPAGGCLPLLLQLPILYALWAVFSSAIELRQAAFVWWIKDLSIPDILMKLPFRIPLFNINELSGLALLMGVTMFVQQKMSVKDPRQKMMVWMMPLLMTLMFNSFPSGMNLYYFVFNLLSIGQQAWINKQHKGEPLRKVEPKKNIGGWITRIAKDLPQTKR
jgi:YidC/Oxa1 family membrane protein insertase